MNENMKSWCEALESGEYKQCKNKLNIEDSYCCLGVACELYYKQIGELTIKTDGVSKTYDAHEFSIPNHVRQWIGLSHDDVQNVADKNDNGQSFIKIARYLRKKYK